MPFSQVRDILNRAVEFHKMLVDFYSRIDNITHKENVKMLVEYMARHEKVIHDELSKITDDQEKQMLEEWIKYEPEDTATCKCFDDLKIDEKSTVDEVIEAGLGLNQCLIDLYHQIAMAAPIEEMKILFNNLETMEIAQKKKLARMEGIM